MKKFMGLWVAGILMVTLGYGAVSVIDKPRTTWETATVSVSTNTATAIYTGSANLVGRTKIIIMNNDNYDVAIGTEPTNFMYSNGYVLKSSGTASGLSKIELPLGSETTIYGLGQSQGVQDTITIKVIEIK